MRCLSLLLSILISLPFSPSAAAQTPGPKISLVIVEGEGAINNVRQRTARDPIVQVEDENHKPIAGAAVMFTLPMQGAGGSFAGGAKTLSVVTDNQGRAVARTFRPNSVQGKFQIHINASFQGQTASATITQSNAVAAGAAASAGVSGKLIAILAIGAAAVAGGVIAATRGGSSNTVTSPPVVTIAPGTGTVGPPR
jgi:hypothetical protein